MPKGKSRSRKGKGHLNVEVKSRKTGGRDFGEKLRIGFNNAAFSSIMRSRPTAAAAESLSKFKSKGGTSLSAAQEARVRRLARAAAAAKRAAKKKKK